jgi:PKD repeat protein
LVARISVSATCGDPGVTIQFTADAMPGATYDWDFNDGGGNGRVVSHQFTSTGTYNVILTVTRSGDTQGDGVTIHVPC